jgi:YHS domain-containing protein
MEADTTILSAFRGKPYYFCSTSEKEFFDQHPAVMDRFLAEDAALDRRSRP